ncbi:MAG: class I SAM-dependent methyltransferase [Deltaproteobacteria bacterium]|nr:class I SAM-dependent methyltransferase [Deltaproteobacteria bacterium]
MEKIPNWLKLWAQLSKIQVDAFHRKKEYSEDDFWEHKARHFDRMVKKRWSNPDSSRQFLQSVLTDHPGSTLLDIGAGTGAWSLFLAPFAKQITALEPSDAMGEILRENMAEQEITNIRLVKGNWPDIDMEPHDYVLGSHSMYGETEFSKFILKMSNNARKTCFLVLRVSFSDALMAKAASHVWGHPLKG